MRLWIHRYTLRPPRRLSAVARDGERHGALLRVDDGFADIHPWPELGDAPLDEQLALLQRGETTALTRASLELAHVDGVARRKGASLFHGLTIPESHWPGPDPPPGFDTIKTKGLAEFPAGVRLRIDFNATLTADEFAAVAASLPRERVDFVEDPCPYDAATWSALEERLGIPLAYDRAGDGVPDAVAVLVHKPAVQAVFPDHPNVVVTSYMDHPVGQFGAAYIAATHRVNRRCGLFTHVLYAPDAFLERVESDGTRLLPPRGTGIGFDDLLEGLSWTSIG
jgi:O-succinylbenzoate synthase